MTKIEKKIHKAINSLSFLWQDEALNGDETTILSDFFRLELDFANGNLDNKEYDNKYEKLIKKMERTFA